MTAAYGFYERLLWSEGHAATGAVRDILMENIPGAVDVTRAGREDDRKGTDYWVRLASGKTISVDAKMRPKDFALRGKDDLALEIWSVVEESVVGWTLDADKHTDFILWVWVETGRWCLVPFPQLCAVFRENFETWTADPKARATQWTPERVNVPSYHSECVFVPRVDVWRAIYRRFGGAPDCMGIPA